MICKWCHGSGMNKAVYGPVMCPDCDGKGYVDGREGAIRAEAKADDVQQERLDNDEIDMA